MKKITALSASAAALLLAAPKALAATTTVTACPPNQQFSALCRLRLNDFGGIVGVVIQIIFVIAIIIALAFLIFGGVKWITSGGDSKQVDAARNMIVAALIGLAIVFLSFFILNILLGFFGISLTNLVIPDITAFTAS